jgi:hypothetical protein|tara:strand:+ start:3488 stop:3763 length:276 start_codon:yes stop_codon:yes gene_type:complete
LLLHHERELHSRIEKLFNAGEVVIEQWEMMLWYGPDDLFNRMYKDVWKRYKVAFAAFYGDDDDAHIQVLRQDGKTLFLNAELLVRLDKLID